MWNPCHYLGKTRISFWVGLFLGEIITPHFVRQRFLDELKKCKWRRGIWLLAVLWSTLENRLRLRCLCVQLYTKSLSPNRNTNFLPHHPVNCDELQCKWKQRNCFLKNIILRKTVTLLPVGLVQDTVLFFYVLWKYGALSLTLSHSHTYTHTHTLMG